MSDKGKRRIRSDAGSMRLMPRDVFALGFIEQMRAVSETDMGVLLGLFSGRGPLTRTATQCVVRRWSEMGFVNASRINQGSSRVLTLTRSAVKFLGAANTDPSVSVVQAEHTCSVARARLILDERWGKSIARWETEREWVQSFVEREGSINTGLRPDAIVHRWQDDGSQCRYWIEVELKKKTPSVLLERMKKLIVSQFADRILYLVPSEELKVFVLAALAKAESDARVRTRPTMVHVETSLGRTVTCALGTTKELGR